MAEQLEDRYIIIKRKDLKAVIDSGKVDTRDLHGFMTTLAYLPRRPGVVIEEDWPEYDAVINMLFERINGV